MDSVSARNDFEAANSFQMVSKVDEIFKYNAETQAKILQEKPWSKDPHFFKDIRISALALLKMVMHSRSGGRLEVMGLLLGKIDGSTMVVMDSFALPVEGTETRVNAQAAAYEYMAEYIEAAKKVGRLENALGWYHSHPGYGCWLSGVDVSTQMLNQQFQEPWVAIVVDPIQTMSSGKVNLGAFRTYPENYKPPEESSQEYQSIPLDKIEDFGVHCKRYYSLDVSYFKSSLDSRLLDLLWNKYWVSTLSSSPLLANADYTTLQVMDLAQKLDKASSGPSGGIRMGGIVGLGKPGQNTDKGKLAKAAKDSSKIAMEAVHGLMGQVIKSQVFLHTVSHPPSLDTPTPSLDTPPPPSETIPPSSDPSLQQEPMVTE